MASISGRKVDDIIQKNYKKVQTRNLKKNINLNIFQIFLLNNIVVKFIIKLSLFLQ